MTYYMDNLIKSFLCENTYLIEFVFSYLIDIYDPDSLDIMMHLIYKSNNISPSECKLLKSYIIDTYIIHTRATPQIIERGLSYILDRTEWQYIINEQEFNVIKRIYEVNPKSRYRIKPRYTYFLNQLIIFSRSGYFGLLELMYPYIYDYYVNRVSDTCHLWLILVISVHITKYTNITKYLQQSKLNLELNQELTPFSSGKLLIDNIHKQICFLNLDYIRDFSPICDKLDPNLDGIFCPLPLNYRYNNLIDVPRLKYIKDNMTPNNQNYILLYAIAHNTITSYNSELNTIETDNIGKFISYIIQLCSTLNLSTEQVNFLTEHETVKNKRLKVELNPTEFNQESVLNLVFELDKIDKNADLLFILCEQYRAENINQPNIMINMWLLYGYIINATNNMSCVNRAIKCRSGLENDSSSSGHSININNISVRELVYLVDYHKTSYINHNSNESESRSTNSSLSLHDNHNLQWECRYCTYINPDLSNFTCVCCDNYN